MWSIYYGYYYSLGVPLGYLLICCADMLWLNILMDISNGRGSDPNSRGGGISIVITFLVGLMFLWAIHSLVRYRWIVRKRMNCWAGGR